MKNIFFVLLSVSLFSTMLQAQFYIGPYYGLKEFGLKGGAYKVLNGQKEGQVSTDASKDVDNVGFSIGYQVIPAGALGDWYKLDVGIDASYSSVPFFERAWDYVNGSGSFAGLGMRNGTTRNYSFDLMPIHRLNIPTFQFLSPFAGVGLGINLFNTSDITVPKHGAQPETWKGNNQVKLGVIVFYGALIRASDLIKPYVMLKHYIPFGNETQLTSDEQLGNVIIEDVPGYFSIVAGVRVNFDLK